VVTPHPNNLIAVWVDLEDIKEGSGELVYLPGSHTVLKFRYGDFRIHYDSNKDKNELHDHHLFCLKEMCKTIKPSYFSAKKGDFLFWHAGLVHGGSEIKNHHLTRKSIVGHYCPESEVPYYYLFDNNRFESEYNDVKVCSMYYKKE
jgi:ectoine hydroxylase-related dioxygenase (phytanoyl-CoA dioxygenase family)